MHMMLSVAQVVQVIANRSALWVYTSLPILCCYKCCCIDWDEGIPWFVISGSPNKSRARAKGLGLGLANYVLNLDLFLLLQSFQVTLLPLLISYEWIILPETVFTSRDLCPREGNSALGAIN